MFAVFAMDFSGADISGIGHSPDAAWESMLEEYGITEEDVDFDFPPRWFEQIDNVSRETVSRWVLDDEDTE